MNDYDSGRIADLLNAEMGYERTDVLEEADLVVVNTCSIREKAQEKTFSDLGRIREVKKTRPGMLIAVAASRARRAKTSSAARPALTWSLDRRPCIVCPTCFAPALRRAVPRST